MMKHIVLGSVAMLMLTATANAYCIRPTDGGFYNPNCITQAQADALNGQKPIANSPITIFRDGGNAGGNAPSGEARSVTTRNYALGSEPRRGKVGTQSVPRGLTELSRREREQALAPKSKLTGPAVRTNPVTGAKSLVSVEISYGRPVRGGGEGGSNNGTHGPGQQR